MIVLVAIVRVEQIIDDAALPTPTRCRDYIADNADVALFGSMPRRCDPIIHTHFDFSRLAPWSNLANRFRSRQTDSPRQLQSELESRTEPLEHDLGRRPLTRIAPNRAGSS